MNYTLHLDAVVFDLDDTLHDDTRSFREAADHVAETCFDDPAMGAAAAAAYVTELEKFWGRLSGAIVAQNVTGMRERVWSAALETVSGAPSIGAACARAYDDYRREHFILWDGVVELLTDLRSFGSKVALLTNGFRETHREKIALLGIEPLVDEIVISDEVGMVKPDPKIFELVCARLGIVPSSGTMIGDRLEKDIVGAQAVGMDTVWLNFRKERLTQSAAVPSVIVSSFDEADRAIRSAMKANSHVMGVS